MRRQPPLRCRWRRLQWASFKSQTKQCASPSERSRKYVPVITMILLCFCFSASRSFVLLCFRRRALTRHVTCLRASEAQVVSTHAPLPDHLAFKPCSFTSMLTFFITIQNLIIRLLYLFEVVIYCVCTGTREFCRRMEWLSQM